MPRFDSHQMRAIFTVLAKQWPTRVLTLKAGRLVRACNGSDFFSINWSAEIEALELSATILFQELQLFDCLDALGDDV